MSTKFNEWPREYTKDNNIIKLEISDYMNPFAFLEQIKSKDIYNVYNMLGSGVLWNSHYQCINKGTIYTFNHNNKLYNILVDGDDITIDERFNQDRTRKERSLTLNKARGYYRYFECTHDEIGSSHDIKYYSKDRSNDSLTNMAKEEFKSSFESIISNLSCVSGIKNIIDIDLIKTSISNTLSTETTIKTNKTL